MNVCLFWRIILPDESIDKKIFMIPLPRSLNDQSQKDLSLKIKSWLLEPNTLFILDFSDTIDMSKNCMVELFKFSKVLKENRKYLTSMNINRRIMHELSSEGLINSMCPVTSVDEAKKYAGLVSPKKIPKVNAEFLSIFIEAAKNTLEVQANTKIETTKKPFIKKPNETIKDIAIVGVINLISNQFSGSISLCFQKDTFLKIYTNMVDEECSEINEETQDAAGELLNIIYGQAKAKLVNEKKYDLNPAIPNILVGEQLKIQYHTTAPVLVIPFSSDVGDFHIEIVIDSGQQKAAA